MLLAPLCWGLGSVSAHAQRMRVEGPPAAQALAQVAAADFEPAKKATSNIVIGVSGTGTALRKLCQGEIDVATAARPILTDEIERCRRARVEFVEVPVAFDAIVVVVNSRNDFATRLTIEELRRIWREGERRIALWSEVNPAWPGMPIKLYGLDGQFEGASYFGAAVLGTAAMRRDYARSVEETALVRAVERDHLALSYVSLGTYLQNQGKLKAVAIAASSNAAPVTPSLDTVATGAYRPLSRPLFLYARVTALENAVTRAWVEHWVRRGARVAREARVVALREPAYRAGLERLQKLVRGSVWEGRIAVELTLEELESRHPSP